MNKSLFYLLLAVAMMWSGCVVVENNFTKLPPGTWRAVLKLDPEFITPNPEGKNMPEKMDIKLEDIKKGELPFTFDVVYENDSTFRIEIINAGERIVVPASDIQFGRSRARAQDTIRINFPMYESYIVGAFAGNVIDGNWVVTTRDNYAIPFTAMFGKAHRFTTVSNPPMMDMTGRWEVMFGLDEEEPYPAVGEFVQKGNHLSGTFLTETGDYRYLEGTVQDNKAWLSTFDGSHAFLFEMKIGADSSLTGAFYSGRHYKTIFEGRKNDKAQLAHPDSLTHVVPGKETLSFSFENPDGKMVSLNDPAYQGKAKVIQIMGTWCPNCKDETAFLMDYLKEKKPENLAVIALAFEKHKDKAKALNAIRTYKSRFGMDYEVLHAGSSDKEESAKVLPMLDKVMAYPTLLFLDKNNKVVKIHTGFSGPATSGYEAFKKDFDTFVQTLMNR